MNALDSKPKKIVIPDAIDTREAEINKISEEVVEEYVEEEKPKNPQEVFTHFIETLKNTESRMYSALKAQNILINENNKIQITFRNNAQIDEFKSRFKSTLLSNLRTSLNNQQLEIEEIIKTDEEVTTSKHLRDADKLRLMIEKNPQLQKLKQDFNLDFE